MLPDVLSRLVIVVAVAATAGCSPLGPTDPQGPGTSAPIVIENFTGTLPLKGSRFYSFSVESKGGGVTSLTLVDAKENGVTTEALITVGLGTPRGTQCVASNALSVAPSGNVHVSGTTNRGVHCAVVTDLGNLTSPATFQLNIAHPK